jgi:hypothetical protein
MAGEGMSYDLETWIAITEKDLMILEAELSEKNIGPDRDNYTSYTTGERLWCPRCQDYPEYIRGKGCNFVCGDCNTEVRII